MEKKFKFNLFNTLYDLNINLKVTKKVPRYATVKPDSDWVYAGMKLKVDSVYIEKDRMGDRHLRLSLEGTEFGPGGSRVGYGYPNTVIREKDLILHY